jgi:hypothetical protein
MKIMNIDEMESEEFPMSPEIIAREQKKETHLKEVMKKSENFSERLIERSTGITYDNKIYTTITQKEDGVVLSYIPIIFRDNTHGSDPETKPKLAQP